MTYFVVSGIHCCYGPLIQALNEAGYDQNNPDHTLIVLGGLVGLGDQPKEVLSYLESLDPNRLILVRGEHEDHFWNLLKRDYPKYGDFILSGAVKTLFLLVDMKEEHEKISYPHLVVHKTEESKCLFDLAVKRVLNSGIANLILTESRWHDYCEIGNRILVHGFYPLGIAKPHFEGEKPLPCYDPAWRNADSTAWEKARSIWGYEAIHNGLFEPERAKGKTIVMGYFYHQIHNCNIVDAAHIYDHDGVVAIDGGTIFTKRVNVYKFKEE